MPDQDESNPSTPYRDFPFLSESDYRIRSAQRQLMQLAGKLAEIRSRLWEIHIDLEEGPNDEAIAEGELPETVPYAIRATIESVCRDRLDGAQMGLEEAAQCTTKSLHREWLVLKRKSQEQPKP